MNCDELNDIYFEWMCQLICNNTNRDPMDYDILLHELNAVDFEYTHPMDESREDDGIGLRYRFAREELIDARIIASTLDTRPCSVLEMLVALAVRCEEQIMTNPEYGDRTGVWFWTMIDNLGLRYMTDDMFDIERFFYIIDRFLDREYNYDGSNGGPFYIPNPRQDLRTVDIWYQLMWYLSSTVQD